MKHIFLLSPSLKRYDQVPYLVHGDVKLAQSNAILRYIAKLAKLQGDSDVEYSHSEQLIEEALDSVDFKMSIIYFSQNNATYSPPCPSKTANNEFPSPISNL